MEMVRVVLVEDEKEEAERTISFLKQYSEEKKNVLFDTHSFASPMEFIETYQYDADLLLLDIRMPGISGMDLAKEIRKKDQDVAIVFITSLAQYAIEGYSVNAGDYILKPLSYPEFRIKMTRILSNIQISSRHIITFVGENGIFKLGENKITYIETNLHKLVYHDNEGMSYVKHQSMKECEDELRGSSFLRINSSYIVNLIYAKGISDGNMVLNDGTKLKISRPRMSEVNKVFSEFRKQ